MSGIKLKPCPRCGGDATIVVEDEYGRQRYFYVECCKCGDMTWLYPSELNAIEAWNRWEGEQYEHT